MNFESLEGRLLLATGPMLYTSFDGVSKKLTITTAALGISNDTIVVSVSGGGTLSVSVGGVNDYNDTFANILSISVDGASGNDSINLGATTTPINVPTTLNGGNGNDTITGGAGADQIFGGAGNDSIDGGLGPDSISGGLNNDTVSYATRATAVNVTLETSAVANDGAVGEGDNVGFGTNDVESLMGGSGNDFLTGSSLGNYISGGSGNDSILGGDGSDTVVGCAGNDTLKTEAGPDFIFAKDGQFDLIDGGTEVDSADTDTTPAEAPLPGALPAPLPAPLPSSNVEGKIDPFILPSILQPLDPYCKGQVLTTRDAQGSVHTDGTSIGDPFTNGDDQFIVQTAPGQIGVDITNNGGLTDWPLLSQTIFVNGLGGNDALVVMGGNVNYLPGNQPGSGTIISDGHTIIFNGINPNQISFNSVGNLTVVTPGAADFLHLGTLGTSTSTELDGQSGGIPIGPLVMDNVQLLTIDTGTNDNAANSNDLLVVDDIPGGGPHVAFLPGSFGSDAITVNRPGFVLVNDPTSTPGQPTVALNINPQGDVTLTNTNTRLAIINLAGHLSMSSGGDKILHPGGCNIIGGTLDINDNAVVIDAPNGTFTQSGGKTNLGGGTLSAPQVNLQGGTLAGNGAIIGVLLNGATLSPGFSPGAITINGNYTQTATGTLAIEIGGLAATDFDQLTVNGSATLDGTLAVSLINGYTPSSIDKFSILPYIEIHGDFATKTGLSFSGGVFVPQTNPAKYQLDVNLAPIAVPDFANGLEDSQVFISPLSNDHDPDDVDINPDQDPLTIDSFTQPEHGGVSKNSLTTFLYTPASNFAGSDSFTYTLRDSAGNTATGTVSINLKPVNDPPIFSIPPFAPPVNENSGAQVVQGFATKILPGPPNATDEANQVLQFIVSTGNPAFFSVQPTIDASGKLAYTTAPDVHGNVKVDVRLVDDGGTANGGINSSGLLSFTVTVLPVPPTVLGALFVREAASNPFPGNYLSIQFSESTEQSLSLADIHVHNVTLNQDLIPKSHQYLPASNTAIITLPSGFLPDGDYVVTLDSAGITDPGNTPLDGDGDGQPGGDYKFSFFQLLGDINLDRSVGFADLVALAQHYGQSNMTYAQGDIDGDGSVGFGDLVPLAQHYGNSLIPPVPASLPVSSPAPAPAPVVSSLTTSTKPKAIPGKPTLTKTPQPPRPAPVVIPPKPQLFNTRKRIGVLDA